MLVLLSSTAIAPLTSFRATEAKETDTIKACQDENLLLPNHDDVQALDELYQRYLGAGLPNADLGLTADNLAAYIVQFAQLSQGESSRIKSLSNRDQSTLNALQERYQKAIAALKTNTSAEADKNESVRVKTSRGRTQFGGASGPLPTPVPQISPASPAQTLHGASPARKVGPLSDQASRSRPLYANPDRERPIDVTRPSNFNTEDYSKITDNPFYLPNQVPLSTFSIDVDTASYSNVRRFLKRGSLPPKDAVRLEEMINYFDYDYAAPKANQPFSINTDMAQAPWNPKHKLVQIGLKGRELKSRQASNLVFLVDVSGSMRSPNKLPLLQRSLCMLVREMKPEDRVTLVTYAGNAGLVLPPHLRAKKENHPQSDRKSSIRRQHCRCSRHQPRL